jgi:thiamine-monophosphate kinase
MSGENQVIENLRQAEILKLSRRAGVSSAIGDDTAIWRPRPGFETLLSCDWFLEGSHFLPERHRPDSVGWKCLARAVSDIAAMGGTPRCFLLSLALPKDRAGRWLDEFVKGLKAASRALNCPIAGGDTTRRDEVLINIAVVGESRRGFAVSRTGARAGDAIFVSGRLGEAEYGLRHIRARPGPPNLRDPLLRKHLYPRPRLALGAWLASQKLASAMMDLSDGLSTDLLRLCAASKVGSEVQAARVPTIRLATYDRTKLDPLALALHGGDDYELLFTVRQEKVAQIPRSKAGIPLTLIGHITSGRRMLLIDETSEPSPLEPKGWDPFRA